MAEKIFDKIFTFLFSEDQVKKILVDLLILTGETIPVNVYDNMDPDSFEQYESDVKVVSETNTEVSENFSIRLSFSEQDLVEFQKAYNEELEKDKDTVQTMPDNVWTQETQLPCGKE